MRNLILVPIALSTLLLGACNKQPQGSASGEGKTPAQVQQEAQAAGVPLRPQPGGLAKEPGIFQALSELNELAPNHLGLYCSVAEPGTVAVGDAISLFG